MPKKLFGMFSNSTWDAMPDPERFLVETAGTSAQGSTIVTVTDWFDEVRRRAPPTK